jgi:uncharacterized protein (DUF488 family)
MPEDLLIYTIGHSDHTTAAFIDLLRQHGITLVVDVRSQPYSRWTHQFNRETLARDLDGDEAGIAYQFMGDVLGGRPSDRTLYDPGQEHPDYRRVERTEAYRSGIERLLELARSERVAVMCSEGDHRHCHRHRLIAQTLLKRGVRVLHVQPDGRVVEGERMAEQLSFFSG